MPDHSAKWQQLLTDLERERDELKVRLHLAKQEARDEWDKAEQKFALLKEKARQRVGTAGEEAKGSMEDIGDAAKLLAQEIRQGFERVRKAL